MLQALKLENASTPVKIRSGTGSDPADSAFAGLMAQASFTPMSQAARNPEMRSEERSASQEVTPQRQDAPEAQAASKSKERPPAEKPTVETPSDSEDQAKIADNPVQEDAAKANGTAPEDAAKKVTDPAGTQATFTVQGAGTQELIQAPVPTTSNPQNLQGSQLQQTASAAKPSTRAVNTEAQTVQALPQAARQEGLAAEGVVRTDAALKGLPQEIQASGEAPALTVKPALTELLSIPKGDIQTLKQNPATPNTLKPEAPKLGVTGQRESTGDAKTGTDPQELQKNAEKPSTPPSVGDLPRPEIQAQQIQNQKHPTLSVETAAVSVAEGVKASQAPSQVAPPTAVRPSPVFTQVEGSIRWILQNKSQGAELQLHPESLGRMVIQLRVEGQEVHARLWASEPTSLAILQDHKAFLESSLREQGLSLGSFDLQSGARGDGAQTTPQDQTVTGASTNLLPTEVKQELPISAALDSANAHRIEVFA